MSANAAAIGADAFAFFTKNQRQWIGKPLEKRNKSVSRGLRRTSDPSRSHPSARQLSY